MGAGRVHAFGCEQQEGTARGAPVASDWRGSCQASPDRIICVEASTRLLCDERLRVALAAHLVRHGEQGDEVPFGRPATALLTWRALSQEENQGASLVPHHGMAGTHEVATS